MIVRPQPFRGVILDFCDGFEQIVRQPIVSNRSVVSLDAGVLLRLSWLNELQLDSSLLRPVPERVADVFGAVVATNPRWTALPLNDLIQGADHPGRRHREVHVEAQSFAIEVVDHVEQSETTAISPLIVQEIHRLALVQG